MNDNDKLIEEVKPTTVLNINPDVDWRKQTMFFGEALGIARYDRIKYPTFEKLTQEQKKNFWSPEDINLGQDSIDYNTKLPPFMKHIFNKNLAYQTMMDSVTSRAILEAFLPFVSLPEVEDCIKWWSIFESIHNRSYQWIQQNLHTNPTEFFDSILRDTNIVERAQSIVGYYDRFIEYSNKVKVFGYNEGLSRYRHKELMYEAMIAIYTLESIRFYVSFCCTFSMGQQELMTGNASEMKLIARDEALHVGISLNILRIWMKEDVDFRHIAHNKKDFVYGMFKEVIDQEVEWAKYLFKDGALLGLNVDLVTKYLEHLGNKRLKALGLDQIFENKANPFNWLSNWLSSDSDQRAPQETEILDYKVSAINGNVDESKLITDF